MKRFSSSYVYRRSNYALIGCEQFGTVDTEWEPIACVAENLLQRGMPTHPSKRLVELLGDPPKLGIDRPTRRLITHDSLWGNTIKGSPESGFNPALDFFTLLLPEALPPNRRYIINYILPEALIGDIVPDCDTRFTEQCVDFYCPRAKFVIEIDGSQHDLGPQSFLDRERDQCLRAKGIKTVRIQTGSLSAEAAARELCERFDDGEELPLGMDEASVFPYEIAIRTQIAIVSLVRQGVLSPDDPAWTIDFTCEKPDIDADKLVLCAIEDVFDLFENICILLDRPFRRPKAILSDRSSDVRLDVSVTKMWSEIESVPGIVYARNDYYEQYDYFTVAHSKPIAYKTDISERRNEVDSALG